MSVTRHGNLLTIRVDGLVQKTETLLGSSLILRRYKIFIFENLKKFKSHFINHMIK